MKSKKFLQEKRVETKSGYVTTKSIKVTKKDIEELNKKIINAITRERNIREKNLEIAEKCVMKWMTYIETNNSNKALSKPLSTWKK